MKQALVCGAGGFIGGHLVKRLKREGFWVRGVDIKFHEHAETHADDFVLGDLRDQAFVREIVDRRFDEVYQLAADMGGAGYIFTGEHDADVMYNSALVNLNVLESCRKRNISKIFYSSSACMYPEYNQLDPQNPKCSEESAYPAAPDSEYGWEKLFSERLYITYRRNHGMQTHVARYHNIFGPEGTWQGGKEKAPAAICRKVALAKDGDAIEIWGDGLQTRSFLHIDECLEGTTRLLRSDFAGPVNIGSEEMVTINQLVDVVADIAGKHIEKNHVSGPTGVRGRNSDNRLIREKLEWEPSQMLRDGLTVTYGWIEARTRRNAPTLAGGVDHPMTAITPLRIGDEEFLITSTIDRCPRVMMLRELVKNAMEAAEHALEGERRIEISAVEIDGAPKLSIWNTGPGMSVDELYLMADISSSIRKQHGLDQNFGIGAKVATLPSNTLGIRYRSCAGGRVHQVVLGKREGVYGRLLQSLPDGGFAEVIEVAEAAAAEGRATSQDWTEVVLMGQRLEQNTVTSPYGDDLEVEPDWLMRRMEERFFDIDASIGFTIAPSAFPAGKSYDVVPPARRLRAMTRNYECVESHGGMRIHYVFMEEPAGPHGRLLATDRAGIALIYKNEVYDLRTDAQWLQIAPIFGIPFAARQVFVFVEIPSYWEVMPETYRQFLRYRSEGQWQIEVHHFSARIVAGRPDWLIRLLASFAPDASHVNVVGREMTALMRRLKIVRRWWPKGPPGPAPSPAEAVDQPEPAEPGEAGEPEYEVMPEIVLVRDRAEIAERGFGDKAALFFEQAHQIFINCEYPAIAAMRDTLEREFAGEADQEAVRAMSLELAEQTIARNMVRALVFSFVKRGVWSKHDVDLISSAATLTIAADDYLGGLADARAAIMNALSRSQLAA